MVEDLGGFVRKGGHNNGSLKMDRQEPPAPFHKKEERLVLLPNPKFVELPFGFGDKVYIDGDKSIIAVVTAFNFRTERCEVECAWFSNGDAKSAWFSSWRLSAVEADAE